LKAHILQGLQIPIKLRVRKFSQATQHLHQIDNEPIFQSISYSDDFQVTSVLERTCHTFTICQKIMKIILCNIA